MKKSILRLSIFLSVVTVGFSSCKKEGCTDADAENFVVDAKTDDGTCQFEGSVVFWYDQSTSESLLQINSTSLRYYIDNQLIGSTDASVYWTQSPDCGANSSITFTKDLGGVKTQVVNYEVIDQDGYIIWEGVTNVNANTCLALELN